MLRNVEARPIHPNWFQCLKSFARIFKAKVFVQQESFYIELCFYEEGKKRLFMNQFINRKMKVIPIFLWNVLTVYFPKPCSSCVRYSKISRRIFQIWQNLKIWRVPISRRGVYTIFVENLKFLKGRSKENFISKRFSGINDAHKHFHLRIFRFVYCFLSNFELKLHSASFKC